MEKYKFTRRMRGLQHGLGLHCSDFGSGHKGRSSVIVVGSCDQSELVRIKHLLTWTQTTTFKAISKNSKAVRRSELSFDFVPL